MPEDYWDFKDADVRAFTHEIHNYSAMMVCPISRNIIRIVKEVKKIESLFDPFAGSGTVLVEGMLANIKRIAGNDINPMALLLMKVKTTPIDSAVLDKQIELLLNNIQKKYKTHDVIINEINRFVEKDKKLDTSMKNGWGDNASLYVNELKSINK